MKLINDNTTQHIVFFPYRRWATYYFVCFLVHVIVLAEKFYVVTFLNKCNKTWERLDEQSRNQHRTVQKQILISNIGDISLFSRVPRSASSSSLSSAFSIPPSRWDSTNSSTQSVPSTSQQFCGRSRQDKDTNEQ